MHHSRMLAESLRLVVGPITPNVSVAGWAATWTDYAEGEHGPAEIVGVAACLSQAPPLVSQISRLAADGARVIAIGKPHSAQHVWRATQAGIAGWADNAASVTEIAQTLTIAVEGGCYLTPHIEAVMRAESAREVPSIRARDIEITAAYVEGTTAHIEEIARRLATSPATVRARVAFVRHQYREHGVSLPSKMILRARLIEDGWVQPTPKPFEVR